MLDLNKPVRLSDGRKARIICTDAKGVWPIVALVENGGGEHAYYFNADGGCNSVYKLENIPEPRIVWINVYAGDLNAWSVNNTRELADNWSRRADLRHLLEINLDTGETKKHEV